VPLPRNECAKGPTAISEVLLEEFAKQPLVRAQRRLVERRRGQLT
jgi:hypothetical protein